MEIDSTSCSHFFAKEYEDSQNLSSHSRGWSLLQSFSATLYKLGQFVACMGEFGTTRISVPACLIVYCLYYVPSLFFILYFLRVHERSSMIQKIPTSIQVCCLGMYYQDYDHMWVPVFLVTSNVLPTSWSCVSTGISMTSREGHVPLECWTN